MEFRQQAVVIKQFYILNGKPANDCWTWQGARQGGMNGAPVIILEDGYTFPALKVSWFLEHGQLPKSNLVQTCGNHLCVNPDHLEMTNDGPSQDYFD